MYFSSDAERQFRYGYHSVPSMRYGMKGKIIMDICIRKL